MKNKIVVTIILVFFLFGTANYLNNPESRDKMGRSQEIAQTVIGFFQATFGPVYRIGDIPEKDDPAKKMVLRNGINEETIGGKLTVVSWNILRNYNREKIKESITKIIEDQNPQLILVQEAPVYDESSFWDDDLFAGFNVYYAPLHQVRNQTVFYNFAHSGQLTLSHYPFTKTATYQLPSVSKPFLGDNHIIKRLALYTQVQTEEGKTLGIYNVHLENAAWQSGRRKQLEYLLGIIGQNNDDVVLIGGDFNTFLSGLEQGISALEEAGFDRLLSGFKLTPRLDHFFVRGSTGTGSQLYGSGSDHQPVMASLNLDR